MFKKVFCLGLLMSSTLKPLKEECKNKVEAAIAVADLITQVSKLKKQDHHFQWVADIVVEKSKSFMHQNDGIKKQFEIYTASEEKSVEAWSQLSQQAVKNLATIDSLSHDIGFLKKHLDEASDTTSTDSDMDISLIEVSPKTKTSKFCC